jgi:hypothetical protein
MVWLQKEPCIAGALRAAKPEEVPSSAKKKK